MRYAQTSKDHLDIFPSKGNIPLYLGAGGVALIFCGIVLYLIDSVTVKILSLLIVSGGVFILSLALYQTSLFKFYRLLPDGKLLAINFFGTKKEQLEDGGIEKISIKHEISKDDTSTYTVKMKFASGKSYDLLATPSEEEAVDTAEVLSLFAKKDFVLESPLHSDRTFSHSRYAESFTEKMRKKYPQGVPRKDPPPFDFILMESGRYRDYYRLSNPRLSHLYHIFLAFLFVSLMTLIAILIFNIEYIAYGLILFIIAIIAFLVVRSIEKGGFEEIIINPDGLTFHRHNPLEEKIIKVPLEKIKGVFIVPPSGFDIKGFNISTDKDSLKIKEGEAELYIVTEEGIADVKAPLNKESAEYLKYLVEKSVFTMSHKPKAKK